MSASPSSSSPALPAVDAAPPEWDRLLSASQKNLPDTIRRLIQDEGVDASHANRVGQSALHIASLWGHVEAVEALLEKGANVNATNTITGATPLHCAIQSSKGTPERRIICVDKLLEAGAKREATDFNGSTPADYCDETLLLERLQPIVPPIFQAIQDRNVDQLTLAIREDPLIVQAVQMNCTPLLRIVTNILALPDEVDGLTEMELLKILLEHGADPNLVPSAKQSSLLLAREEPEYSALHQVCLALKDAYRDCQSNRRIQLLQDTARLLKAYQATNDIATEQLLHEAARRNLVDMATFLMVTMEISPNVTGRQGMTPLQFAARSGKVEMVQLLLSQDTIDIDIRDERGQTALDAARTNQKDEIVTLLENFHHS